MVEATINSIYRALRDGRVTCCELVEMYLMRIEAYDRNGPKINSVVSLNPRALEEADRLDREFKSSGKFVGPLHGIPVLVKDQIDTKDIPTTYGSVVFRNYVPREDATTIRRLREAGAIILGKTSMPDFVGGFPWFSSASGETRNPYALDRTPGGSSSGTAAGVAANFAVVGIGEDTGASIRCPSSFCNLFGLRVTTGLISRAGVFPLVPSQDTVGPMTRSVRDLAVLMDVLVGYDPADPLTANILYARIPGTYTDYLVADGLRGARIGVLRDAFGSEDDSDSRKVNRVVEKALEVMRERGAEVVDPVVIPNLWEYVSRTSLYTLEAKHAINSFLAGRPDAPVHSVEELYASGQFHPLLNLLVEIATKAPADPESVPEYHRALVYQERFQRTILNVMAQHRLDVIAFPDVRVLPPLLDDLKKSKWRTLSFPFNTFIASQARLPAISIPAGFTDEGIPVGLELVGKPFDEPTLIKLAYSFEQAAHPRRPPQTTPPL